MSSYPFHLPIYPLPILYPDTHSPMSRQPFSNKTDSPISRHPFNSTIYHNYFLKTPISRDPYDTRTPMPSSRKCGNGLGMEIYAKRVRLVREMEELWEELTKCSISPFPGTHLILTYPFPPSGKGVEVDMEIQTQNMKLRKRKLQKI